MIRQNVRGSLWVALAAVLWGSVGVVAAALLDTTPLSALWLGALRLWLALPLLVAWQVWYQRRTHAGWIRREHRGWVVVAGIAFAGYQVTYFAAIPFIGVAAAVMLNLCSAPLFAVVLARLLWRERMSRWVMMSMLGAIGGVVLLVAGNQATLTWSWWGVLLALSAGLCYSLVAVASQVVSPHYAAATVVSAMFGVSSVCLGVAVVLFEAMTWPQWSPTAWWGVVYLALVPTTLSYLLYVHGLRFVRATTATTVSLLEPLTSVVLAVVVLHERLSWQSWGGAALLLGCTLALVWAPTPIPPDDANECDDATDDEQHGQA